MRSVSDYFHDLSGGDVVPLDFQVLVSFDKRTSPRAKWFETEDSLLDGGDLLASEDDNPLQLWDIYDYVDYSERVIDLTVSRDMQFPYSVQTAVCDVTFNNYDGFFNYDPKRGLKNLLPARPIRAFLGYKTAGVLPQFVGLSEKTPELDDSSRTASISAFDFLAQIGDIELDSVLKLRDVRTDEALKEVFKKFGINERQFSLDRGHNTIPFLFFDKGTKAKEIIQKLVMAELGELWLDEEGVLRFTARNRQEYRPSLTLDESHIISLKPSGSEGVINHVKAEFKVRAIQPPQAVFVQDNKQNTREAGDLTWIVPASGSYTVWLNLNDPCWQVFDFLHERASRHSYYEATREGRDEKVSNLDFKVSLFYSSAKLVVTNTNPYRVKIDLLELVGEPAKVVSEFKYDAKDEASIAKFGEQVLDVSDNEYFGNLENVTSFGQDIIASFKDYNPTIEAEILTDLSLQMGDCVEITGKYAGFYRITAIENKLDAKGLKTKIKARKFTPVKYFILDVSKLNGTDVLGK